MYIAHSLHLVVALCSEARSVALQSCSKSPIWPYSLELLTKLKADHQDLLHSHVWGCPAVVFEAKLKNNQKLPKWNRHAHWSVFRLLG